MSQTLNLTVKIVIFISLLLTFNQAATASSTALYEVDVLVVDEEADTRWRVLKEGLEEVFIRISGDSIVMDKLKRPPASRYVKQYSYNPVEEPVINEQGEVLSHRLKIQYNGSAMQKYLRENGYPVWGEHRSDVVVWLAIRDGKNEYVLKDTDRSLLKTSADEALHRRGIPQRWPLYDYKDRKILKVADIRGGFKDPVSKASKRYSSGSALTGSLIWNGSQWQSSWSLLMASGNRHWSIEDADYNRLINKAIDQAADAMGIVFAIHGVGNNQQLATVQLDVQAVNSINKYRKLENYLRELSAVEMARLLKVDGQAAVFEITLRSSEEDFLNLIKNDAELVEAKPTIPKNNAPVKNENIQPPKNKTPAGTDVTANNAIADNVTSALPGALPEQSSVQSPEQSPEVAPQIPVYYYRLNH